MYRALTVWSRSSVCIGCGKPLAFEFEGSAGSAVSIGLKAILFPNWFAPSFSVANFRLKPFSELFCVAPGDCHGPIEYAQYAICAISVLLPMSKMRTGVCPAEK